VVNTQQFSSLFVVLNLDLLSLPSGQGFLLRRYCVPTSCGGILGRIRQARTVGSMNRAARIGIITISAVIFCAVGLDHVLDRTPDKRAYKSLTIYNEVLQKIQNDYVDDPNIPLVTAGSLHGLLESLDPQSSYLTPREYAEYKQKIASNTAGETGLTL